MCKDDKRTIEEPANTNSTYAPHAVPSGMGIIEEEVLLAQQEAKNSIAIEEDNGNKRESGVLKRTDFESNGRVRGQDKVGGMLAPIEAKGAESRARRPIRPNLSGDMESSRLRKKLVLTEKMAAIETLRQAIVVQRQALDDYDADSVHSTYSTYSHSKSQGSSRPKVDQY